MNVDTLVRDLAAFSIQVGIIGLAVAVLVKVIHVPAPVRYHGLRLALLASLLVPWLLRSTEVPPSEQPAAVVEPSFSEVLLTPVGAVPVTPLPSEASGATAEPLLGLPWLSVMFGVFGIGVVARGLWLAVGLIRLRRMTNAGTIVEGPEYLELQQQIGARATIVQAAGLAQPATFGLRRPVVMLPDAFAAAPASLRRAVIVHELYHVRRRDWFFVLTEELVRTMLWFHPAILWLTSHIQLAREEIVDELTVRATGDRRGYMHALLSFADTGGLRPAPAFAHRRQLFQRILSVSKETVMSTPRMVISFGGLVAVVATATWSASSLFPIVKASSATVMSASLIGVPDEHSDVPVALLAENHPRISTPIRTHAVSLAEQTGAAGTPRQVTPENPIPRRTRGVTPAWPAQAAGQQIGVVVNMRVTIDRGGSVIAVDRSGCSVMQTRDQEAGCDAFYDATAAAIRQWRYERPAQAPLQFNVAVSFKPGAEPAIAQTGLDWQQSVRDTQESLRSSRDEQVRSNGTREVVARQLVEVTDKLREVEGAYSRASELYTPLHPVFSQLHRELDELSADLTALQQQLRASGAVLSNEQDAFSRQRLEQVQTQLREAERRLAEYRRQIGESRQPDPTVNGDVGLTPITPLDDTAQLRSPSGRTPVRVEGAVTAPRVRWSQKPEYTAQAMAARIEGTVRVEALVDEDGRVADARIVKSLPLLDAQALAAAKQWIFTPGLLNGEPVPVLVTIELEFNLRK